MDFITGKHISRRSMLKGMGASVGLPLLDAMVPASRPLAATEAGRSADSTRLVCIENVHGSLDPTISEHLSGSGHQRKRARTSISR